MANERNEFAIIAKHFAPLARSDAARGLMDDVALLGAQGPLALTADAIVEGVHFLPDDPLNLVARKALRVNVSDLVAKGAEPFGYLLTLAWPDGRPAQEIETFARGLGEDQKIYGLTLLGGDTVSTPGPLTVSVMMLGRARERTPTRAEAREGEDVWVSGTIGDAGLGLRVRRGELAGADADYFTNCYRLPAPPSTLGAVVVQHARAAMDVSDGLLADAAKIGEASGVLMLIDPARVPHSEAARRWIAAQADQFPAQIELLRAGDDYQVLLTARPGSRAALEAAGMTLIGRTAAGAGVALEGQGAKVDISGGGGFAHRLGR